MQVDQIIKDIKDSFLRIVTHIPHGFPEVRDQQFFTCFYLRVGREYNPNFKLDREIYKGFRDIFTESCQAHTAGKLKKITDKLWKLEDKMDALHADVRKARMSLTQKQLEVCRVNKAHEQGKIGSYDYLKWKENTFDQFTGKLPELNSFHCAIKRLKEAQDEVIIAKRELAYFRGEAWTISYDTEFNYREFCIGELDDYLYYTNLDYNDPYREEVNLVKMLDTLMDRHDLSSQDYPDLDHRLAEIREELYEINTSL